MRIVIASDDDAPVLQRIAQHLRERGHEPVLLPEGTWGPVATEAARRVAAREFDQGIVCCWTGTGVSIAANKIPGIRAALCTDAATAAGARRWNDANVLALSLRLVSHALAVEIVDAWLDASYGGTEGESLALLG
jgi:RpiB/LacA/LacB family sugar-phosphate isomerase